MLRELDIIYLGPYVTHTILILSMQLNIARRGVNHGGRGDASPSRIWSGGGAAVQIVPPDFDIFDIFSRYLEQF